ncbi:LPXTG cell wall anchor domain-containing protein, partial [Chloroflexus sp.]
VPSPTPAAEPAPVAGGSGAPWWLWIVLAVIALGGAGLFVSRRRK